MIALMRLQETRKNDRETEALDIQIQKETLQMLLSDM